MSFEFARCPISFEFWFILYLLISLGAVAVPIFILNVDIIGKGENVFLRVALRALLMALIWPVLLLFLIVLGIGEGLKRIRRWVRLYIWR